jgi:hypothetical protein
MTTAADALKILPDTLRDELLDEYKSIIRNYAERRWSPSELSGGRFSEIVYSILDGHAKGSYPAKASKPANMVDACRALEKNKNVPRSFQILLPRLLPPLYEVRNQRGVGHVGGAVDPNHMDATLVVSMANFVLAELIRQLHNLKTEEAQALVDAVAERRIPLVWKSGQLKRVLVPKAPLEEQVLLLLAGEPGPVATADLFDWLDYKNKTYFAKLLKRMHDERKLNQSKDGKTVELLPPGSKLATDVVNKYQVHL